MLPKPKERARAIKLRYQGFSYSEIIKQVPVSQAVLSLWLRHIKLTDEQKRRLVDISAGEGARMRHKQRLDRLNVLEKEVEREIPYLLTKPFFTLGLALYWAEGSKQKLWNIGACVRFSNSDPTLILLMQLWFKEFCGETGESFTYRLYIHDTADVQKAREKWTALLGVKPEQIAYSLKHHQIVARHKHDHYIGLISLRVKKSAWLNRRIDLWTRGAATYFLQGSRS